MRHHAQRAGLAPLGLPERSSADLDHPRRRGVGVVTELGLGTAGIAVGDEVYGLTDQWRDGTAAEYVAVEARNMAPKPQTADHGIPGRIVLQP